LRVEYHETWKSVYERGCWPQPCLPYYLGTYELLAQCKQWPLPESSTEDPLPSSGLLVGRPQLKGRSIAQHVCNRRIRGYLHREGPTLGWTARKGVLLQRALAPHVLGPPQDSNRSSADNFGPHNTADPVAATSPSRVLGMPNGPPLHTNGISPGLWKC